MHILPFEAIVPNLEKIIADEVFFDSVKEEFPRYLQEGLFSTTAQKAIYIYQIATPQQSHWGVVAALDLDEYRADNIKKHEKTLLEKEKTQLSLLLERAAMVKPVLLTHQVSVPLREKIKELTHKNPILYELYLANTKQTHRFWQINSPEDVSALQDTFGNCINKCYVADGHHRLTANMLFEQIALENNIKENFNEVLCAFFATDELSIAPFHRTVQIDNLDYDKLHDYISSVAEPVMLSTTPYPTQKSEWAMCYQGNWTYWRWKKEVSLTRKENVLLDVNILNEVVFQHFLGIEDARRDKRIGYIEGLNEDSFLTKKSEKYLIFKMYPVDIQDLIQIADADDIMPPKSTWFEPRMRNGLLIQPVPDVFLHTKY